MRQEYCGVRKSEGRKHLKKYVTFKCSSVRERTSGFVKGG
jgi:hypothetical protein